LIYYDVGERCYRVFSELFRRFVLYEYQATQQPGICAMGEVTDGLAPLDKKLFDYLKTRPNVICTFEELLQEVWGEPNASKRGLEAAIHRIRNRIKQLDNTGWEYIRNVRGLGYEYRPLPRFDQLSSK